MFGRCFSVLAAVVASVAFALSPGTAVAQHHGGGGGGGHAGGGHAGGGHAGGGHAGGGHAGFAGGGHAGFAGGVSHAGAWHGGYGGYGHHYGYGGYGHHYGYGGYGYPGYYYGGGLGLGFGSPWYGGYDYTPSYYNGGGYYDTYPYDSGTANYYYGGAPAYNAAPYTDATAPPAGYSVYVPPAPARDGAARVRVVVPAGAKVWFNDSLTKQAGTVREFESPSLTPGREYSYDVRAQWREGDRDVTRTRRVDVGANSAVTVDFTRANPGE